MNWQSCKTLIERILKYLLIELFFYHFFVFFSSQFLLSLS